MVFPEVMYGCESWNIKKTEHERTDAFKSWCQRRLLRFPWTERRSNQSILKKINLDYSLERLVWSPCCSTDSLECSTMIRKHQFFGVQPFYGSTLTSIHDYWKNHSFDYIVKVMSLVFNMLSRFVTVFLPRSKHLLILWLQSPSTVILEPKKIKFVTVSIVCPSICHEVMGLDAMILKHSWVLSQLFHSPLSPSSKRLFNFSWLSAIKVVSSAYLRLLIFLLAILIPACDSSSRGFLMMYFA